jgi:hypothetical protein
VQIERSDRTNGEGATYFIDWPDVVRKESVMKYLERMVFRARSGKAGDVVSLMKKYNEVVANNGSPKGTIFTDLTGPFDTVVVERIHESLDSLARETREGMPGGEMAELGQRYQELVEAGERELYMLED